MTAAAPANGGTATPRVRRTLAVRFADANTTHDGRLTEEQARAKMPSVARDFAAIDTTHKGYVSVDEIREFRHARYLARRAAKNAAAPQQPTARTQ